MKYRYFKYSHINGSCGVFRISPGNIKSEFMYFKDNEGHVGEGWVQSWDVSEVISPRPNDRIEIEEVPKKNIEKEMFLELI